MPPFSSPPLQPLVAEGKEDLQSELLEEYKAAREGRPWTLQARRLGRSCRQGRGARQQGRQAAVPLMQYGAGVLGGVRRGNAAQPGPRKRPARGHVMADF